MLETGFFDRKWKFHDQSKVIDMNTLPHKQNIRDTGKCIQMVALEGKVQEIMSTSTISTITYHGDGSKKQGDRPISVQGITVGGICRTLPTLPISSESRQRS